VEGILLGEFMQRIHAEKFRLSCGGYTWA
jgi:hypothetical protein